MRRLITSLLLAGLLATGAPGAPAAAGNEPAAHARTEQPASATAAASWPRFASDATLHIQFTGKLRTRVKADVFEIDGEDSAQRTVARLRRSGRQVICYVSAGSVESYRPDARKFPRRVVGRTMDGWPDERWLDVRRTKVLLPLMRARVRTCAAKGFTAVEFDNVDGYANRTGFRISKAAQLRYNRALARMAHRHGMAAVLKNAPELVPRLVKHFDAALVEQCAQYAECAVWRPFVRAGKPVWDLEYAVPYAKACRAGRRNGISVQVKKLSLNGYRRAC